jgi:hypothetical protein
MAAEGKTWAQLTIHILTHLHEKDVELSGCDVCHPIEAGGVCVEVAQDHEIPRMFGAGLTGPCQNASCGGFARKKAPGDARSNVAGDVDVDCLAVNRNAQATSGNDEDA